MKTRTTDIKHSVSKRVFGFMSSKSATHSGIQMYEVAKTHSITHILAKIRL